jgi:carbamate kinase
MRVVVALGGNALLERGEPMTARNQRANVRAACEALAPIVADHDVVVTHGNGPQVGLLALQGVAYHEAHPDVGTYPLDVLGSQSDGMIGYVIMQELGNLLAPGRPFATLLTQVEVDRSDPAFGRPDKPIGPLYGEAEARRLAAEQGWSIARDGDGFRRVVPSPAPRRIVEIGVVRMLVERHVVVVAAGGGGIPTTRDETGRLVGVEAVVDKDRCSELIARELDADVLVMLTDVAAVEDGWGTRAARRIRRAAPRALAAMRFAPGSMGPKVEAACHFVEATRRRAGIGALADARAIVEGRGGTTVASDVDGIEWYDAAGAG